MTDTHLKLMIPGPTEFSEDVLAEFGKQSYSHVAPQFLEIFSASLALFRGLLKTKAAQPFIISGSGSLGWEFIAANFVQRGDTALVLHHGYFADSFKDCLEIHGISTEQTPDIPAGDAISPAVLEEILTTRENRKESPFKLIGISHVDTSTGVRADIQGLCEVIKRVSPGTLIAVDGVCSFGAEEFRFDEWGVDLAFTGSQKALGVPPGLMLLMVSKNAMDTFESRILTTPPTSYYCNVANWLKIMRAYEEKRPSYFATPAVNHVCALRVALEDIMNRGIDTVVASTQTTADKFRAACKAMGLKLVSAEGVSANTMTAAYFPEGVDGPRFLKDVKKGGVIIAGGLHKDIKARYFRVGHMGVSAYESKRTDVRDTVKAIEAALRMQGVDTNGAGIDAFDKACV
eukprot:84346_1